jgi:adenosylcobinamide-GDP ribazoletransferase
MRGHHGRPDVRGVVRLTQTPRGLPAIGPFAALQFLTRLPVALRREPDMAAMVVWFPAVGAVIGAIAGGIGAGMFELTSPLVAGALAVTTGLLVTGAFHEDGLGDIADAFGGGYTVERRLEIMKDSRHGTYGVAAMCASIVIRIVAIGSMPSAATVFAALVAAHAIARGAAVALMAVVPLAGHSGLGADYGQATTVRRAVVALAAASAIGALVVGWWALPILGAALVAVAAAGALAKGKIGGISGDVLGAAEQVAECAVLVVLVALAGHHPHWWS